MIVDIQAEVSEAILTDLDYDDRQSERIIRDYNNADDKAKVVIDNIFISLCGWSLVSIIKGENHI